MSDGIKLGQLLCDADIITKRQLSKALAEQVKGRKGTIGEILVEMGFCSFDDITDTLMNSSEDTKKHEEKHEEIHQESIVKEEPKPTPVVEQPKKKEPIELSEDKVLDTKFTLSVQTMIAAGTGLASLIGMWYTLQGEIEEAKELPKIDIESIFGDEYPSKPDGHNWPRSYEQYKNQVGGLQEDMDAVYDLLDEYEETIKELQKDIKDLERRKRDK
jgi:gas vesicle protein